MPSQGDVSPVRMRDASRQGAAETETGHISASIKQSLIVIKVIDPIYHIGFVR